MGFLFSVFYTRAQVSLNDFGRVILNTYLADNISIPSEAKNALITKLSQIASNNGMAGSDINPRFIITANINIGSKDIIAGPPQMVAQNLEITFFIGDAVKNVVFSSLTLSIKGVGSNENKSFMEAFKSINPKSKDISSFCEEGKSKILRYYSAQCDFIIKEAQALASRQKYNEAIYNLSLVPEVCKDCYFKCLDEAISIFQKKINEECSMKLKEAKSIWASSQIPSNAEKAGAILATINPMASCNIEVNNLLNSIEAKLKADEKARWQFKMKQYADKIAAQKEQVRIAEEKSKRDDDYRENQSQRDAIALEKDSQRNYELDKLRVNSYREVAIEYAKNQPKTINYTNVYWR